MRYQRSEQENLSGEEFADIEKAAHDADYADKYPFDLGQMKFDPSDVWRQNDAAHKYGTHVRGYRKRRLFEMIDLTTIDGKHVLDYGCGIGQHSVFFAMHGARVDAFDLSPVGIERAREVAHENGVSERCRFSVANGVNLPYSDNSFDLIVFNAVLHHVVKYNGVAGEVARVLKPGGDIFFAEGVRENKLYEKVRAAKRKLRPSDDLGDIDLEIKDLRIFFREFEDLYVEQFSLFEKFATSFGRRYEKRRLLRAMYFFARKTDDFVFWLIPSVRAYGLEVVGRARKPGKQGG